MIALVITVIVLLILAGVSISSIGGNRGLIKKANDVKQNSEYADLKEAVERKLLEREVDRDSSRTLRVYLEEIPGVGPENVEEIANDTYVVKKGELEVTVYDEKEEIGAGIVDGRVEIWDGKQENPEEEGKKGEECPEFKETEKGSKKFNWYIYTPAQLEFLASFVNQGNVCYQQHKKH